ncbi:MAG: DNA repair protein RecO [Rubrivivax sp.]
MASARLSPPRSPLLSYVLHRHDWSETSLIVELLTREQGRIVVAAKGAKRPNSQLRPVLMPFQPLQALLGKAPADESAEIHNLRGAEWAGGVPLLGPAAMFSAFYLNELLLKLLPRQDPHPLLFDAYADTLGALAGGTAEEPAALRAFELFLLRELGWLPDLALATLTAAPLDPQRPYTLDADSGLVAQVRGAPGTAWLALDQALQSVGSGGDLTALRAACAPHNAALRGPLRNLLHYHLGTDTLRTRRVWQGVHRLAQPGATRE